MPGETLSKSLTKIKVSLSYPAARINAAGSSVPQTAAFADVNSVPFNPMVIGVCNGNTANTPESVWGLFVRFYVATGASSGRGVDLFLPQAAGKGIWLRAVVNNAPHSSGWRKLSLDDMQ